MRLLAVSLCFLLAGCAGVMQSETVYLKKDDSVVTCGPYPTLVASQQAQATRLLRDCVSDYQRQGYNRVPRP